MSEKTEQSQSPSELPEIDDFNKLTEAEQAEALDKNYKRQEKEKAEQDTEDSENTDEVSDEEETDEDDQDSTDEEASKDEDDSDSESDSTDNQEGDSTDKVDKSQQLQTQIDDLTKKLNDEIDGRKALQADYTKKATRLKELEKEKSEAPSKETAQATSDFDKELKDIEEKDPEIGKIFRRMHEGALHAAREQAQKEMAELRESLQRDTNTENLKNFQIQLNEAIAGKYKDLEKQFDEVSAELYPDDEGFKEAASSNPDLFAEIEKEVRSRYPREVIAAEDKLKKESVKDKDREKDIKKVKGIKKTKVSKKKEKDASDLDVFNKLSLKDQEIELEKQGKWSKY